MPKSANLIYSATIVKACVEFEMTDKPKKEYLGDGVYAHFDGDHIWLAVNRPDNDVLALDEHVASALMRYIHRIRQAPKDQSFGEYSEG